MKSSPTQFNLSLNKLVIGGFIILIIGALAGTYGHKIYSLKSSAFGGCMNENNDVNAYRDHLIGIIRGGGTISQRQMNTFLDLIEIRDSCQSEFNSWKMTA